MSEETIAPSVTSALPPGQSVRVIVVGAGGTGGRLIPPLMQVLRRGDSIAIVDGDHVEDRNLVRQNFRTRDVGANKAEVLAQRYRKEGIQVDAYATMLSLTNAGAIISNRLYTILAGCVDHARARKVMHDALQSSQRAMLYVDGGNEMRGGQVVLSAKSWPANVKALREKDEMAHNTGRAWSILGMKAMPQLLKPGPWHCDRCDIDNAADAKVCKACQQPEASCQDRIDLQTVAVNQLSATAMLNIISCVLYGVPMSTCGAFFSTLNTMTPIKLKRVDWGRYEIHPETTYASE